MQAFIAALRPDTDCPASVRGLRGRVKSRLDGIGLMLRLPPAKKCVDFVALERDVSSDGCQKISRVILTD
jgi:hypothetical protein